MKAILFLLFINDLLLFLNYCYSNFFADNAAIHTNSKILKKNIKKESSIRRQLCKGANKIKCIYILTKQDYLYIFAFAI